jgi:uncharacterized membrane protein
MPQKDTNLEHARRKRPAFRRRVASVRFAVFLITFVGVALSVSGFVGALRCILVGFDAAALIFIASVVPVLRAPSAHVMRRHARDNDANRVMLLIITITVMLVILTAIAGILRDRDTMKSATVGLVVSTLALSWLFSNIVYALHYAHLFYGDRDHTGGDDRGLAFPSTEEPVYADFVYFAFTIGMTFQTSDVEICTRRMRRIATYHALAAFVFNIGVLAFAINVVGSSAG